MNALFPEPLNHALEHNGPASTAEADAAPAAPVVIVIDHAEQRARRKARVLELQRARRQRHPRIDYSPSPSVRAIIEGETFSGIGGDYSSVINRLIERAMR